MQKKHINPDTLLTPRGYSHIVTVEGAQKLAFISGQVAVDKEGKIVGPGDLKIQIKAAAENLVAALAAVGAKPSDIVKMNTYIVQYKQADYAAMREARAVLFPTGDPPASTLIGVHSLAVDGLLVE
ncbi:MAG TPA: RidA family protein, partial [Candidatus Binataceae bacterium]|nr:RidA family protein [Candidatus Binataceae bacterium]